MAIMQQTGLWRRLHHRLSHGEKSVTIPPTPNIVVTKQVSSNMADESLRCFTENWETELVLEAHTKLTIEKMQTEGPQRDDMKPITSMGYRA